MGAGASRLRERAVKTALLRQLQREGAELDSIVEWLWEDFGIRVRRDWRVVERAIIKSGDVGVQDLVVFMLEQGIEPNEGAWDVQPTPRLRGRKDPEELG